MNTGRMVAGLLALPALLTSLLAQAPPRLPVLDDRPSPQVTAGGPSAAVTALAFNMDGETLYAAGLDKVVRVWTLQKGKFVLKRLHRVPVGPGNAGSINAVALSSDGAWLAMGGRAPMRGEASFRGDGVIVETASLSPEQNLDSGVIYVANTSNPAGGKVLRGHQGGVRVLAFAPASKGKSPLLVSAAIERDGMRRFGGLRLWDAATGKLLAERTDLPAKVVRPGVAVWHTGPGASQVRVAVAWPEEDTEKQSTLRLWEPGQDADPLQTWTADRFTRTAALLGQDEAASVLTGGVELESGRLRVWRLSADRPSRESFGDDVAFPPLDKVRFLPVSLTVFSSRAGAAPTHAAVVLQPSVRADFRLALVDLRTSRVVANVSLTGSDTTQAPAIAAHGRHIVVAATRDHAIRVYTVADLLEGKTEPEAVLAGTGLEPRRVAFVDKGRGLWLSEDGQAERLSGGLVFDLDKRQVRANNGAGLIADTPALGEWTLTIDKDRKGVSLRRGEKELPVRLRGKDEVVTAAALRPAAPGRIGVLAVAYTERDANRTLIMLCNLEDGKPFRLLISHLQNVNELAFAASRPLLASVADDQTAGVWGLADLDRAVGQVPGLGVGDEGKKVVVRRIEAGTSTAKTALAEGDVLEKVGTPGGEQKAIKNAADFLLTVSARRPGDQVEVTVAGKGAVKLPVERGVDEAKPLFLLFLLRTRGLPEWVGWSPAGPYDCGSPAAEARLGWHTNTGDPAAPVSFVEARIYSKDYYRPGILGNLAAEADLGRALQKWKKDNPERPPQPSLRPLRPERALPGERSGEYLVRQALKTLRVGINEDYALDANHLLRWRLTRTDAGKVKADAAELSGQASFDGKEWQLDLSGVEWRRGDYRVRVGLYARADKADPAGEMVVALRFQPPAPGIALRQAGKLVVTAEQKPLEVLEDKLSLEVALETPAGQDVEVRFEQSRNGLPQKDAPPARNLTGAGKFPLEFKLREGLNRLAVRAVNKGALAGHEDAEADRAEVWVSYKPPRELPPRFPTLRLEPEPEVKRLEGKEVWVVSRPAVRLLGKIEATGVLVQADWSAGGEPKSVLPAREQEAKFSADLELKPGEVVTVRLRAKSQHSDESTAERQVVFYPLLPAVAADPIDSQDCFTEKVALAGTLEAATKDPFNLIFRITSAEGKVKSFKPDIDVKAGKWKVELALFPGINTVEAQVSNEWREERTVDVMRLRYRRPPKITAFPKMVEAVETNKVELTLTVESPVGRPLTAVTIDENPVSFNPGKPETQGERWVWEVALPEVFVNDGDGNLARVTVQAVTDEGESAAAVIRVVHKKLSHPPEAQFILPTADDTSRRFRYPVTYRVESRQPLERVEIRREGKTLHVADLKKVERQGALHILQEEAVVTLKNGANALEVVAVNRDGRSPRAQVVVSCTGPAVLVDIDRVELMTDKGEVENVLRPVYRSNGDVTFPTAPRSLVWLVGWVRWSDPEAKALNDRALEVVVKVGDCRQFPVALGLRGKEDEANIRPFRVPVVLIGTENRIKIDVPSIGQQELSRRELELTCAAPAKNQRLHVLIIGVNVKDSVGLKKRILDALNVEAGNRPAGAQGEFFKKPPFERCVLYHVLAGEVERGKVEAQLVEINNEITRLKRVTGWLNDVVLIYYQGEDKVVPEKKERWLKTSINYRIPRAPTESFAIPCHDLPRVPGAQLLLLNVAGPPDGRVADLDWGGDPDTGLMRYAFHDPAEPGKVDPALLGLLQEAIRKKGRLGEVVNHLNDLLGRHSTKFSPLVVLDKDQASRRINEPDR